MQIIVILYYLGNSDNKVCMCSVQMQFVSNILDPLLIESLDIEG
jgi:hypothetical protein